MLHQLIKPTLLILGTVLPVWLFSRAIIFRNKQRTFNRELILLVFISYSICVLIITLYPLPMTRVKIAGARGVNFVPVINTIEEFSYSFAKGRAFMRTHSLENIIGNVILLVPLGILLPLLSTRFNSFKKIFIAALLFSLSIEVIQLVSRSFGIYRSADVDDVILNITGALVGLFILRIFIEKKKRKFS
jgi:glycopeptide antibiotics resistance protein